MKSSLVTGFSFGLTSGIITTLGLIVGLSAGTHSKLAVIGGIVTIAIADAFSDALGIHVSQESQKRAIRSVWESTVATLLSKFFFALTFLVPVYFLELSTAIIVSIVWGFSSLIALSFVITKHKGENPWRSVLEHLTIGVLVVIVTQVVGSFVKKVWG